MPTNYDKLFNQEQGDELIDVLKGIKKSIDGEYPLETVNVTLSDTAQAITPSENYYGLAQVNVPGIILTPKTIAANGRYYASDDNADGYSSIIVNVSGGGSGYIEEWDFTESLEGKIRGRTPAISGAVQDSSGVTFDSTSDYLKFGGYASWDGITIEVDVGAMNLTSGNHRRFLMRDDDEGFIYRSNGKWAFYAGNWAESNETDGAFFANSTVKVHVDVNGYWHIYKDGVLWWEPSYKLSLTEGKFFIGSGSGNTINNAVITGMRIY